MTRRRVISTATALAIALSVSAGTSIAKERGKRKASAIESALKGVGYLERTLPSMRESSGTPRKQFTMAVTGLVMLLAKDVRSSSKRPALSIDAIRKYLDRYADTVATKLADPAMIPERNGSISSSKLVQFTWPLAMSAVFFAECHARGIKKRAARASLAKINAILIRAQAENGGWGHGIVKDKGKPRGPDPMDGYGMYADTLVSTTNLVAPALHMSNAVAPLPPTKNAATKKIDAVGNEALERAIRYFKYAEHANGNFPYDPSQRSAHKALTGVSRAAGAAWAMHILGIGWRDVEMSRALEFVDDGMEYLTEGHGSATYNFMLAAFLFRARGNTAWDRFRETFFARMIKHQSDNGSFECICRDALPASSNDSKKGGLSRGRTEAYVTAMHTLILLLDKTSLRAIPNDRKPEPAKASVTGGG